MAFCPLLLLHLATILFLALRCFTRSDNNVVTEMDYVTTSIFSPSLESFIVLVLPKLNSAFDTPSKQTQQSKPSDRNAIIPCDHPGDAVLVMCQRLK